jgi:hypothetical protein
MTPIALVSPPPATSPTGKVSTASKVVHAVAVIFGAAVTGISAAHLGVHGTAETSTGLASGALVVLGSAWKYLASEDKALAGQVQAAERWGWSHVPGFAAATANLLPSPVENRLKAIEDKIGITVEKDTGLTDDQIRSALGLPPEAAVTTQMRSVLQTPTATAS